MLTGKRSRKRNSNIYDKQHLDFQSLHRSRSVIFSVFRSSRHIYAQIIDDTAGRTIVAASTVDQQTKDAPKFKNKVAAANFVGKIVGERALNQGIKKVVFDRNGFLYHGRVKSLSEGARKTGLVF